MIIENEDSFAKAKVFVLEKLKSLYNSKNISLSETIITYVIKRFFKLLFIIIVFIFLNFF